MPPDAKDEAVKDPLERMLGEAVVLDTGTSILYIGVLSEITDGFFVLGEADMHDCRDGHANKENYLIEARKDGTTKNRHEVVVMRSAVISVSRLSDIVAD